MAAASKNIFWLSFSRVVALLLLFVAYTQLFRYLGPTTYGQYQYILSFVTIFGIIIDFGIQQYIIKKMSEDPAQVKRYFHNFLAVEILLVFLIYGAIAGVAWLGHYEAPVFYGILVAGLGTALNGLTYPFLAVMSSFFDLRKVAFINFMNSLINFVIIFAAIYFDKGIVFLAGNQIIFALIGLVLYYRFIQAHIPKPDIGRALASLDIKLVRTIFKAALPFALLVGFSTVYNRIDVVLITHFLGYTETGYYTAAYKFFDLLGFFPAVVSVALYPVFASLMARKDISSIRLTLERYLRFLIAGAIPMAVGGMLLSHEIITVLAGKDYSAAAAPTLAILVWAPAILFIYIVVNALVISQLTRFAVIITCTNVFINVIGNLLLLPHFGIRGAAIMTVISEFLQGAFYFYFVRKKITDFSFWIFVWRPLIASAVMGAAVYYARPLLRVVTENRFGVDSFSAIAVALALAMVGGGLVYGLALLLLGFVQSGDIAGFKKVLKKEPLV